MEERMNKKLQERLPEANEIMNSLKKTIDNIHSALRESDAVLFRQDLATLIAKWANRVKSDKKRN